MAKKNNETDVDLYYVEGQAEKETLEEMMKRKKVKEREKRLRQSKKEENEFFDLDTEIVIGMTNKNNEKKQKNYEDKIIKQNQKMQKKKKKIKRVLRICLLIVIIIGGIIFATCSPIFNIKEIKVLNNTLVSSENIISLSGLTVGENLFKFSEQKVKKQIKENPYIDSVEIKRIIPNEVQIDVVERVPRFSVSILGNYAYINSQGYILEITQNELNLPVINGTSTEEEKIEAGNRLNEKDLEKLEVVLKIMSIGKENNLDSKIKSIDINNENDYIVRIEEELKTVHLGDESNLNNKILYVLAILEQEKGKEGTIYVNGDFNNKKFQPYFREKV